MLIACALFGLFLSLCLTPVLTRVLELLNVMDVPDGDRKIHVRAVPRLGGVSVMFCLAFTVALEIAATKLSGTAIDTTLLRQLAPPVAIIFVIGVVDDLVSLQARYKLVLQSLVALLAVAMGIHFGPSLASPWTTLAQGSITVIWLVLGTNAFNLIDGMDGLATGLGIVLSTTIALGGINAHDEGLTAIAVLFAACLLGFLWHNFTPASIFLGDSGSLTIGFLLSCLTVLWSNRQPTIVTGFAPILAFSVPLADVFLSVSRRYLRGRPLFLGDRDHVHHRLLQRGLSSREATLLLYRTGAIAAALSLVLVVAPPAGQVAVLGIFVVIVIVLVRKLGYVEFDALWGALRAFSPRRDVSSHLWLQGISSSLARARRTSDCWPVVKQACADLGFDHVRLVWRGRSYGEHIEAADPAVRWSIFISINKEDSLALSSTFPRQDQHRSVLLLLNLLRNELNDRSFSFEKSVQGMSDVSNAKAPPIVAR
jgi:UDP-GlcNAc:undecaprenyl-phosphate GlcNAc-1-phosphate transferase